MTMTTRSRIRNALGISDQQQSPRKQKDIRISAHKQTRTAPKLPEFFLTSQSGRPSSHHLLFWASTSTLKNSAWDLGFGIGGYCNPPSLRCCPPACFETTLFPNCPGVSVLIITSYYSLRWAKVITGCLSTPAWSFQSRYPFLSRRWTTSFAHLSSQGLRAVNAEAATGTQTHSPGCSASETAVWPIIRFS